VRLFQEKQPSIRSERPQLKLWRTVACLNEARIFDLFDVKTSSMDYFSIRFVAISNGEEPRQQIAHTFDQPCDAPTLFLSENSVI
jgi:hypothetical protein